MWLLRACRMPHHHWRLLTFCALLPQSSFKILPNCHARFYLTLFPVSKLLFSVFAWLATTHLSDISSTVTAAWKLLEQAFSSLTRTKSGLFFHCSTFSFVVSIVICICTWHFGAIVWLMSTSSTAHRKEKGCLLR